MSTKEVNYILPFLEHECTNARLNGTLNVILVD